MTLAPLALRVAEAVPLVPTATLPTAMVVGVTESCPAATAVPFPERGMVRVRSDAAEVRVTVPLALPALVGAKVTVNGAL